MTNDKAFLDLDTEYQSDKNASVTHSVASRNNLRQQLQAQVEEFLARGGKIAELPPNARSQGPQVADTDMSAFD